ncbi:hypothetical protein [Kitasatospora sp. McL0602]|uniref:DUF7927 domain-containing protein n=1 Tax=Kitasatospora sp. McL0602 TaxID=3439530 RepID=UPI003F89F63B
MVGLGAWFAGVSMRRLPRLLRILVSGALVASSASTGTLAAVTWASAAQPGDRALTPCTPTTGFDLCRRITFSGGDQTFTVPAGVTSLDVRLWGAGGGGHAGTASDAWNSAGGGGYTTGRVAVTPGQLLTVTVGRGGVAKSTAATYGGGGTSLFGASGGGMSALWSGSAGTAANALLIAGGGGGAPAASRQAGGSGGGGGACGPGTVPDTDSGGGGGSGYIGGAGVSNGATTAGGAGTQSGPGASAGKTDPLYTAKIGDGGASTASGGNGEAVIQWVGDRILVSKTAGAGPSGVNAGSALTYQVTAVNADTVAATVNLSDDLSGVLGNATYNNDASAALWTGTTSNTGAAQPTYAASKVSWSGTLNPGQRVVLVYSVAVNRSAPVGTALTNQVSAAASNCRQGSADTACTTSTKIASPAATCDGIAYVVNGGSMYALNLATGVQTRIGATSASSIGYSRLTGTVWGVKSGTAGTLYEYNPTTNRETSVPVKTNPVTGASNGAGEAGTVSLDGRLYYDLSNFGKDVTVIDIDRSSPLFATVVSKFSLNDWLAWGDDADFHPVDGYLCGTYDTDIRRIDITRGGRTIEKVSTGTVLRSGSVLFDSVGDLYTIAGSDLYEVDLSASRPDRPIPGAEIPAQRKVTPSAVATDAAGCLKAQNYGDAPDTYKTLAASGGPVHDTVAGLRWVRRSRGCSR